MELGQDTVFIGARWNPSVDKFFYICVDHSAESQYTEGWFIDDLADEWQSFSGSSDPMFLSHRAMFIRAVAAPETAARPVPDLGTVGMVVFVALLAIFAFLILQRRQE